jgi:hypothetical protein
MGVQRLNLTPHVRYWLSLLERYIHLFEHRHHTRIADARCDVIVK